MEWLSSALFAYDHVVLNAGSRVDLDSEQLCMKPASIFRRKQLIGSFVYFHVFPNLEVHLL